MASSKKGRGISLFLILLVLSLIYFISTAFIFHSATAPPAQYYSATWFLENSQAHKPNYPFLNIAPPENYSNYTSLEYLFETQSDTRNLSWRFLVLSQYVPHFGWIPGNNNISSYTPPNASIEENISVVVRTNLLPASLLNSTPLPALWDPFENQTPCSDFDIYDKVIFSKRDKRF